MKTWLPALLFFVVWLAPFATGVFDVGCWFWVGAQCTAIDWGTRGVFVVCWTLIFPFVLLIFIS